MTREAEEQKEKESRMLALRIKEARSKPKDAGCLWKLEKAEKWILSWSVQKDCSHMSLF